MNQYLKLACLALLASAVAACSGVGSSLPTTSKPVQDSAVTRGSGDLMNVHVMVPFKPGRINPNIPLIYHNGPVLKRPVLYVVYWGFGNSGYDPSGEQPYLTAFLSGIGGSPWMNTDHQYYQIVGSLTQHIANEPNQLVNTWVDMTNPVPSSPSDAQIQAEAGQLMAHFAFNKNASYVVATPHLHNSPGFGGYCAYHGATTQGGHVISYTNLPYMTDQGRNCGENAVNPGSAGLLDGVSIVEGHEYAESQTDPQLSAWWASNGDEIGDLCAWVGLGDITLSTGSFAVQPLYSNKKGGCALHTP